MEKKSSKTKCDEKLVLVAEKDNRESSKSCRKLLGIAITQACAFGFAISAASVQMLERAIPDFELNAIRVATGLLGAIVVLSIKRKLPKVPLVVIKSMTGYCFGSCGIPLAMFISVTFIDLATNITLDTCVQLLLSMCVFTLVLKEPFKPVNVLAVLVSIVGVILVVQPPFLFPASKSRIHSNMNFNETNGTNVSCLNTTGASCENNTGIHYKGHTDDSWLSLSFALGCMLAMLSAIFKIINYVMAKVMNRGIDLEIYLWQVQFWVFFSSLVVSLILMLIWETPVLPTNWTQLMYVALHSVTYCFILPGIMYALTLLNGNLVTVLISMSIIYSLILQYTLLLKVFPGKQNWQEVVGIVFVFFSAIMSSVYDTVTVKKDNK